MILSLHRTTPAQKLFWTCYLPALMYSFLFQNFKQDWKRKLGGLFVPLSDDLVKILLGALYALVCENVESVGERERSTGLVTGVLGRRRPGPRPREHVNGVLRVPQFYHHQFLLRLTTLTGPEPNPSLYSLFNKGHPKTNLELRLIKLVVQVIKLNIPENLRDQIN